MLIVRVLLATAVRGLRLDKPLLDVEQRIPGGLFPVNDLHPGNVFATTIMNRIHSGRTEGGNVTGRSKGDRIRFLLTLTMAVWNWLVPNVVAMKGVLFLRSTTMFLGRAPLPLVTGEA